MNRKNPEMASISPNITMDLTMDVATIFFVKAPVPGQVKTRLCPKISEKDAAFLYENFVKDIFSTLCRCNAEIRVYFSPQGAETELARVLGPRTPLYVQQGNDLGEKMSNAFQETFAAGYEKAVLIGSDIPDISTDILGNAIDALTDYPAVIGPSTDGGYYLIGFQKKSFAPGVFSNIAWSGPDVLSRTRAFLHHNKIDCSGLPALRDIDTWEDLKYLFNKKEQLSKIAPNTFDSMKTIGNKHK